MVAQETILQNAYETTLTLAVGADATEVSLSVAAAPVGSPSASTPMYLVIDPDSDATREYVKVTSRSGATLTVVRNIDTDSGGLNAHAVGAKVRMVAMKQHFDELHDRVDTIINSDGTAVVTTGVVKDEDDMVSDSDTHLATQQSIKAYVDSQVASKDDLSELTGTTDDVTEGSLNLYYTDARANSAIDTRVDKTFVDNLNVDADTLDGNDSTDFATSAQGTLADSAVQPGDNVSDLTNDSGYITASSTDSLTNKTFDVEATGNSISNIDVDDLKSGVLDTDLTTVSATDDTLPSAKATKAYTDSQVTKTVIDALNIDADTLDGNDSTDFATSAQGTLADSATQPGDNVSTLTNDAGYITSIDLTTESIDELSDVDTSTVAPTEGQALLWDDVAGEWQPGDVASSTAAKIIDADGDTQIQTDEGNVDEDVLRFDTAGVERATLAGALDLTDDGGAFIHSQTQAGTYTINSGKGTLFAGPITITGTVTNAGTMVVI